MNVENWKPGKLEEIIGEMKENCVDILGVTQTTLRGEVNESYDGFVFIGKGRKKQTRNGGGVGVIFREGGDFLVEGLEVRDD